jgi:hypothetical protein
MSHFTVLVVGENPEDQLAPFSENLTLERYVEYTRDGLIKYERDSIEKYRLGPYQEFINNPDEYTKNCKNDNHIKFLKEEFPLRILWTDDEVYKYAIRYHTASDIGKDGEVYSTRNPNSKWDWCQLGGRWAGSIKVKDGIIRDQPNFSYGWDNKSIKEVMSQPLTDSAIKKDIANIDEISTFAVLKDGVWYERGSMGWFGMVHDEKDENAWSQEITKLIESLPDDVLLSIYDCHI